MKPIVVQYYFGFELERPPHQLRQELVTHSVSKTLVASVTTVALRRVSLGIITVSYEYMVPRQYTARLPASRLMQRRQQLEESLRAGWVNSRQADIWHRP